MIDRRPGPSGRAVDLSFSLRYGSVRIIDQRISALSESMKEFASFGTNSPMSAYSSRSDQKRTRSLVSRLGTDQFPDGCRQTKFCTIVSQK